MRLGAVGVGKGDALGDQPARARRQRRGDQIGRPFDAQTGVARQPVGEARRIDHLRQIGQLMNDHVRPRADDDIPQGILIENIDDNRRRCRRPSGRRLSRRDRVVPVTAWPAEISSGVNRRPIAPPAPARKIRTMAVNDRRR